ncbi:tRNA (guanine(37)-N(1))-methyltransferase-like [Mytilus edulis]|uniref:tRNA (guanine(37)-N(1))-methyltransferase-like n=1 Tax=Mytilus edulis TaxID=6550 RepID=UPI0039EEFBA9
MFIKQLFHRCIPRLSSIDSKRLVVVRTETNGHKFLQVARYKFFDRIPLINLQAISSNFYDIFNNLKFKMDNIDSESEVSELCPPKHVIGMKVLDKSAFKRTCKIPGVKVPIKAIKQMSKCMKLSMLRMPKLKPIADLENFDPDFKSHKLFLLNPLKYKSLDDFSNEEKQMCNEADVDLTSFQKYDTELCYENWTASEIIPAIVKTNVSGFSIIGHIAHLNLKDEVLQYKHIIGQVLMDKNPSVKTVVNKTGQIDNTFRNFKMELIAGEDNMMAQAKEHGFTFEFDFSKVYWNPRLSSEHQRVVKEIKEGDIVYDVFAGVGPFAIPAAKSRKAIVFANDLNPSSYESLCKNIKLNKIKTEVNCSNLDGREFIKTIVKPDILKRWKNYKETENKTNLKVVMNLPALGIEFTDTFQSLFVDIDDNIKPTSSDLLPYMYVYCFTKSESPEADVKQRIESTIGSPLPDNFTIHNVRNVAPKKEMMCVSFHMPAEVLFRQKPKEGDGPEVKKRRIESE